MLYPNIYFGISYYVAILKSDVQYEVHMVGLIHKFIIL